MIGKGSSADVASDVKPILDDESKPKVKKQKKSTENKGGRERKTWTAEEDRICLELAERICVAGLWDEVKRDGRLEYRGSSGVKVHIAALFKKMRKAE